MNLRDCSSFVQLLSFRLYHAIFSLLPGGKIQAFGRGPNQIGEIVIVNLERQPQRLKRTLQELRKFRSSEGIPLSAMVRRLDAVDARDGRAVAATPDVDQTYSLGNQLYVQPDARLKECFSEEEQINMTRQEVAVARSHIEVWKSIVKGTHTYVLVLEDDIWFTHGAGQAIDRGWNAAVSRSNKTEGPHLVYLSYEDAGGTVERVEVCKSLFRPLRGLWFLSGYVLSREGAEKLLRAMPVVGPVDMWINYRFAELGALALTSPVIRQRPDGGSNNCYSILPYLARAGVVDASAVEVPTRTNIGPIFAWTGPQQRESLAMALSMLGFRVRVFDDEDNSIGENALSVISETFDALVNISLAPNALSTAMKIHDAKFIFEGETAYSQKQFVADLPPEKTAIISTESTRDDSWNQLCSFLGLVPPIQTFPIGAPTVLKLFRDNRVVQNAATGSRKSSAKTDDSAWALIPNLDWPLVMEQAQEELHSDSALLFEPMTTASKGFRHGTETFPGNSATFDQNGLKYDSNGVHLVLSKDSVEGRPYRSGMLSSERSFNYGRFQVEIKAARGPGLVTGFFLYRNNPRQEIDIELTGDNPQRMLTNVYFNPGDEGAIMNYGYRGSPCSIELGFDSTESFHTYAIEWRPGIICWSVDGRVVHTRASWEPTPIPHLPMRLHANLWSPRSLELAGRIEESILPASATFRNVSIWA